MNALPSRVSLYRWSRRAGLLSAPLAIAVLALAGCDNGPPTGPEPRPPEVEVSRPIFRKVTDYESLNGRLESVETVELRARVTGYLMKSYLNKDEIREGTEVEKDQILFLIDPRPYKAELARAEASITQNKALAERLKLDYERAIRAGRGAVSPQDIDKIAGDLAAAEAATEAAKASRDVAKLNLNFTEVKAPISGRVSRRLVDPGNMVKADDTILTSIVSLDPMHAYFDVPERSVLTFRRLMREGKLKSSREARMPVMMELSDEDDYPHQGYVDFVDNRVDAGTGTLKVRGVFENPKDPEHPGRPRLLSPGLFVRVRLAVSPLHPALLVAERALGSDQGRKFVWVVSGDDRIEAKRYVQVGAQHDRLREIEKGLKPGERIVVNGLQRVREGIKIRPKPIEMAPGAGEPQPALATNQTQLALPRPVGK